MSKAKLSFDDKPKNSMKDLFGSTSLTRTEDITVVGGLTGFDQTNRFNKYQQFYTITPHAFMSFQKLGLTLVKNFRFEGKKNLVKNFEKWSEDINFGDKLQTMARLALMNGTYVALYIDSTTGLENNDVTAENLDFVPLLMSNVTLLPDGVEAGLTDLNEVILPPVTRVYIDENSTKKEETYRKDNCFIFSYCPRDKVQTDILGRETYGIYGTSLFDSIEDVIYDYVDLVSGYTNYIKKYGIGRYFIDYSLLAEMVKDGSLTFDEAIEVMQNLADSHAEIKENEDIVGIGFAIKQLDSGGSNINVVDMKNSLETDIQIGLLQSPITMGRSQGSTFASAYVAEDDRLMSLEGIQKAISNALNAPDGIIGKRLKMMNKKPGDIKIVFEELSKPAVTANDMYQALLVDAITTEEYRTKALNLPAEKPESGESIIRESSQKDSSSENSENNSENLKPDDYPEYPSD
jgi:hypothetical protein